MSDKGLVTIFGGSGFVGRYIVRRLLSKGYRVRVACRRPDLAHFLQPMGTVGQVHAVQANLRYPESVEMAMQGASHVINCVGILSPSGKQTFESVIDEGAEIIANAALKLGVNRIIHLSAIGADSNSDSEYQICKGKAENHILSSLPNSTIMRPSLIFGAEDEFFNRFALIAKYSPLIPLFGAHTKFQPIYVDDVAASVVSVLEEPDSYGKVYELGGSEILDFQELIKVMLDVISRKRVIVAIPDGFAGLATAILRFMPYPFKFTKDQYKALQKDNVVSEKAKAEHKDLTALGIKATPLSLILPQYLVRYRSEGQFTDIKHGDA